MADRINDIIDVEGSIGAINKVVDSIVRLETVIDDANQKTLTLKVDAGSFVLQVGKRKFARVTLS